MNTAKLSPKERQRHWARHIELWQQSGLSRTAYCKQEGLNLNQLCYWINKDKPDEARQQRANFIQVQTPSRRDAESPYDFSLRLCSGDLLQWSAAADPGYVTRLVQGLRS